MTKARSGAHTNPRGTVREFFSEATLPALNSVVVNRGIDPHAIIAIIEMHGQSMATRARPQFRVLYEVH